jgi:hypothetical protein
MPCHRDEQRVFIRKILIQRADAETRPGGDGCGGQFLRAVLLQNLSRRVVNHGYGLFRPLLGGGFSWQIRRLIFTRHVDAVAPETERMPTEEHPSSCYDASIIVLMQILILGQGAQDGL